MPSIVIFYHPGGEHSVDKIMLQNGVMLWNTGKHCRKFIETQGDYFQEGQSCPQTATLRFWGEWEADSYVRNLQGSPRFLHTPFLRQPLPVLDPSKTKSCVSIPTCTEKKLYLANTDPLVFGEAFYYSVCQQNVFSSMTKLEVGSIILFGSRVRGMFAVDTVFVVGDKKRYNPKTISVDLAGFAPSFYPQLMQLSADIDLTCYKGATYSDSLEGMYSFVPCRLSKGGDVGIDRPILVATDFQSCSKKDILSNGLQNQGIKVTKVTIKEVKKIWECIRKSFSDQNYMEGFNLKYDSLPLWV